MGLFRDLIKDVIREEIAAGMAEEGAGTATPPTTPSEPREEPSINSDDKTPTENTQPPSSASESVKTPTKEESEAFNVELRKMIKKEVRDTAASLINKRPSAAPADTGVNVDDVFAKLLGFPTNKKGD